MAFDTFKILAQYNGWSNSRIVNTWVEIYPTVRTFNRAENTKNKNQALGMSKKGESIVFTSGGKIVGSRWGRFGTGTGNAYCKKGC